MIKLEDVRLQPNTLLVEIPIKKTKVQTLTLQIDEDSTLRIAKMGMAVAEFIDVELGDGVLIGSQVARDTYSFEDAGVKKSYFLLEAHEIMFAVKASAEEVKVDVVVPITEFADPNIESPALDHIKTEKVV